MEVTFNKIRAAGRILVVTVIQKHRDMLCNRFEKFLV